MTELPREYTTFDDDRPSLVADPATARELVGDALEELEVRGVPWSEILNVLVDVAQLCGQHEDRSGSGQRYTSGVQARTKG